MISRGKSPILSYKFNRKQFLKYSSALSLSLGYGASAGPKIAKALETAVQKPPLLWIEGQSCGGCTASALNSTAPSFSELLLEMISLRFSESLSWGDNKTLFARLDNVVKEGKHIVIISGAIPTAENGAFCKVNTKTGPAAIGDFIKTNCESASAVIASGGCASNGGIMNSLSQFKVTPVSKLLRNKKVINIPGCPPHPDWLIGTIVSILIFSKLPQLDDNNRPTEFFSQLIHDNCPRRGSFEAGDFAESFNGAQSGKCLYKLGCKGMRTHADCPTRKWNQKQNWCIQSNSLCIGCASEDFYEKLDPLFSPVAQKDIPVAGKVKARDIGKAVLIGTGAGIAANEAAKRLHGRKTMDSEPPKEIDER